MLFGPPGIYAEGEKVHGLSIEKVIGKVLLQIQKICKTRQQNQHLYSIGERAQSQKIARQNKNSLIKNLSFSGEDWGSTINNKDSVKKGCTNMCAPASVNLYKHKPKQIYFSIHKRIEETLSYGRYTLANFQNSQCQNTTDYIKSPSVHSSIIFVDGQHTDHVILSQQRWLTHFSRISITINTSLESITSGSEYFLKNASTHSIYPQASTSKHICLE